jgi:hypothetical protein
VTSVEDNGDRVTATGTLTVSRGELKLISNLVAAPNPVSQQMLSDPAVDGKVWIKYQVAGGLLEGLRVKIYNVAGELVQTYEAGNQSSPADPLGTAHTSTVNCAPGDTCGTFYWNGRNTGGTVCAPGLYVVAIEAYDKAGNVQRQIVKMAIQ